MKTSVKLFALGIALLGFGMNVNAQGTSTSITNATATATIFKALTISQTTGLDFGKAGSLATSASTVVLDPAAGDRSNSTADLVGTNGTPGTFSITGEPNAVLTITLPTSVTLNGSSGEADGESMVANTWKTDQGNDAEVTLDEQGKISFNVGATLQVAANQKSGTYNGTYTISINYN